MIDAISALGWVTFAALVVDYAIAQSFKRSSKEAWVRYERVSAPLNAVIALTWVIVAELPLIVDGLLVFYALTQYIGFWAISGGPERMNKRIHDYENEL